MDGQARRRGRRGRLRRDARSDRGLRRRRRCGHAVEDPPGSKPLGSGRGRDQRGARKRLRGRSREARVRHRQGLRLPRRPGRDRDPLPGGARRRLPARALGGGLLTDTGRAHRSAALRCRRRAADGIRRRHHRPRPHPRPLRAGDEARHPDVRGVLRVEARRRRRALSGRHRLGSPGRRAQVDRREDRDPRDGRRRAPVRRDDERVRMHRRRDGDGASRRRRRSRTWR